MKKLLALFLAILFVMTLVTACGSAEKKETAAETKEETKAEETLETNASTAPADVNECKTLGDVMMLDGMEELQTAGYEGLYVYVFSLNGTYYRAIAKVTKEQDEAIWALDMFDENYEADKKALLSPLEIDTLENLSDMNPSQEELDQWVGKTGEELFNAGWTNAGWDLSNMTFWMDYGPFQYDVVMEGEVENPEDFEEENINALVVKSVTYNGQLGEATNLEIEEG